MIEVVVDNVYVVLNNVPTDIEREIFETLTYEIYVYQSNTTYKKRLYSKKNHKTYTGLLPYIIEILDTYPDDEYKIVDNRIKPTQNANYKIQDGFQLRPYQKDIVDNCGDREIIRAATGGGKCLPLDTPILTPNGFIPLENIHIGDIVYDENGKETTVIGEYPQGKLQQYEITFNDGTSVRCCENHLWKFTTKNNLCKDKWNVDSLKNIIQKYNIKCGESFNLSIPVCKPIQFTKKQLSLPPYLLGALLGDGGFSESQITFTNTEEDVIDKVKQLSVQFNGEWKQYKGHNIQYHYIFEFQ